MQCAYCGTPTEGRRNYYAEVPVCSDFACYEQYLIEHGFRQIIIPNMPLPRNHDQFSPASHFPLLHQMLSQIESPSPDQFENESISSNSDYSDYDRDYEDEDEEEEEEEDLLDPLRYNIDQDIDFIEIVFEELRNELHTYSNKAAVDNIKKTMKDVDCEITELMQDIEPPCDNIRSVIRRIRLIKQQIDQLYEELKTVDQSIN